MSTTTTEIAWTDRTWNPVRGCSRVSEGCMRCYAEGIAYRFSGPGKPFNGLVRRVNGHAQWSGKVVTVESSLLEPLSWRKPARVFVNSMSDLFHEDVPDAFIDQVFAVMAAARQHTFQILTKRADRMREYLSADKLELLDRFDAASDDWTHGTCEDTWPLPNVWLGVSVEDQKYADERIPLLLQTPAAVRFISAEPLLGPVDLSAIKRTRAEGYMRPLDGRFRTLDWVIVGGESGPGARPFDLAWPRSIVQQCKAAGVPVFVKQLGARPIVADGRPGCSEFSPVLLRGFKAGKGGNPEEWPADLRVREFPGVRA